jgi:hypothetical protein
MTKKNFAEARNNSSGAKNNPFGAKNNSFGAKNNFSEAENNFSKGKKNSSGALKYFVAMRTFYIGWILNSENQGASLQMRFEPREEGRGIWLGAI